MRLRASNGGGDDDIFICARTSVSLELLKQTEFFEGNAHLAIKYVCIWSNKIKLLYTWSRIFFFLCYIITVVVYGHEAKPTFSQQILSNNAPYPKNLRIEQ